MTSCYCEVDGIYQLDGTDDSRNNQERRATVARILRATTVPHTGSGAIYDTTFVLETVTEMRKVR